MAEKLKIIPLGGLNEIGKNMTVYEYGSDIIIVDVGMGFPDDQMYGIDVVIPDVSWLVQNKKRIRGIVLTHGRTKRSLPARLLSGLLGLYDGINYAADLLSYSRILALGLAAGVIAQVVNILATMGGASFIGILMMIVVFIIGHLLNLAINVLGSFVHAARLQYIEFFGKFYEDGGTPFRPMATSDRYTVEATSFGANENN